MGSNPGPHAGIHKRRKCVNQISRCSENVAEIFQDLLLTLLFTRSTKSAEFSRKKSHAKYFWYLDTLKSVHFCQI